MEKRTKLGRSGWLELTSVVVSVAALIVALLSYASSRRSAEIAQAANKDSEQLNAQFVFLQADYHPASDDKIGIELSVLNNARLPAYGVWVDLREYDARQPPTTINPRMYGPDSQQRNIGAIKSCTKVELGTVTENPRTKVLVGFVHYTDAVGRRWVRWLFEVKRG